MTENTSQFNAPPPPPPYAPPPSRGRKGFAAAVLAGALVVGGGAGIGGAALWSAIDDDEPGTATSSQTARSAEPAAASEDAAPAGSVEAVAEKVLPSVVKIDVTTAQGSGSGSGIILSSDGRILTNNHVVEMAAEGGEITVAFNDGSRAEAEILGRDPLTDTAVIQAKDVEGLTPAALGRSDSLKVGEQVVAIGSPFGLESTVTSGIVSALDRPVDVGSDAAGNRTTYPAVQTDAAINPGNSGGPLVNMDGEVIGINSSIRTASTTGSEAGSIGLGFAIPLGPIMPIVDQMAEGETPTHARLGISVSDPGTASAGIPGGPLEGLEGLEGQGSESPEDEESEEPITESIGAVVREVAQGSTADEAGIERGDVITKIDDSVISGADSLVAKIRSYRPGDEVTVTFERDGQEQTVDLELDSDDDSGSGSGSGSEAPRG